MKRLRILCAALAALLLTAPAAAAEPSDPRAAVNWYCRNNDTHTQPQLGSDLSFVTGRGGVYLDTAHGDTCEEKVLYLTFDAGYENGNVAKILDALREHGATGAFFVLENLVSGETELVRRMAEEGHLVCNHTLHHRDMTAASREEFTAEVEGLAQLYAEKTGREMARYYRPPEGRFSAQNLDFARELGYTTVFWSFAYADWDNDRQMSAEAAKKKVLDHTHNGAVILLHPTSATNAAILGDLLAAWKAEGYRFGTLDELVRGGKQ